MRALTFSVLAMFVLTACGSTDRPLRALQAAGGGPDEFAVILANPLVVPDDTTTLPEPTPGGGNRADPTPNANAIAALGGSASARIAGGIPANDAALVAHTARYGVDPAIRSRLAAEDARVRERARTLNVFNPLNRDRYFTAYRRQALDAQAELARLSAAGVRVPVVNEEVTAEPMRRSEQLLRQLGIRDDCVFTTVGSPDGLFRRVCSDDEEAVAQ